MPRRNRDEDRPDEDEVWDKWGDREERERTERWRVDGRDETRAPRDETEIRETIRAVARYQKVLVVCILVYAVLIVARVFVPDEATDYVTAGMVLVGLTAAVVIVLLAVKVELPPWVGVVIGALTLVPFFGLLVLLAVNIKATIMLKENGVPVGLFGAARGSPSNS